MKKKKSLVTLYEWIDIIEYMYIYIHIQKYIETEMLALSL